MVLVKGMHGMFVKLLIADRGEIAVRIIRTCAEMSIRSVAIYSEVDRDSLHVARADEAYLIGDDPLHDYHDSRKIVELARETGCDAIHPGYGPLSESSEFARICSEAMIAFIGPGASIIDKLTDKTVARRIMYRAGIPITPGSTEKLRDCNEALCLARTLGYPVMLKPSRGSGGHAIRRCDTPEQLERAWQWVVSAAMRAFGSADIFMEKCIAPARHVEVQVLADRHGSGIHLFERDCSIQRHYRKMIEIAPSPHLTPEQRAYLGELAIQATAAIGYQGAGSVEFLVKGNEIYFMEINPRIAVEHTTTEAITGVDLVREQIRIAAGEKLSFRQQDIQYRGFSMQLRINAEDPQNRFSPTFGRINGYFAPGGPGVRTDTAIYTGYTLACHFDPLCLKLIVWGLTWEETLARGIRALSDMRLQGIKTTAAYYQAILRSEDFSKGNFDSGFVTDHPELLDDSANPRSEEATLAIATAIAAHTETAWHEADEPAPVISGQTPQPTKFIINVRGLSHEVIMTAIGDGHDGERRFCLTLDGKPEDVVFSIADT